eukprot:676975-Rhodomonas_salina.5
MILSTGREGAHTHRTEPELIRAVPHASSDHGGPMIITMHQPTHVTVEAPSFENFGGAMASFDKCGRRGGCAMQWKRRGGWNAGG